MRSNSSIRIPEWDSNRPVESVDGESGDADYRNSIQGPGRKLKVAMRPENLVNAGESTRRN